MLAVVIKNFLSTSFVVLNTFPLKFLWWSMKADPNGLPAPWGEGLEGGGWGPWGSPITTPGDLELSDIFTLEVAAFLVSKDSGVLKGTVKTLDQTIEWANLCLLSTLMLPC